MRDGERKLAAIMFTDMVGYSKVTHRDETLSLELLAEHNALVRQSVARFKGREIRTIGDAFLVVFDSAVEAVLCAAEIQRALIARNANEPESRAIVLRIGIHVGDVVDVGNDVFGDGVNIAARLQALAGAGETWMSQAVYDQVSNKVKLRIEFRGTRHLKNIAAPVRSFSIFHGNDTERRKVLAALRSRRRMVARVGAPVAAALISVLGYAAYQGELPWHRYQLDRDKVVVLPFRMISADSSDDYLSAGTTEEVVSRLSTIKRIRVLAHLSAAQFRKDGKRLGIGTVVEGSVRKAGDKVRISVRVNDVSTHEAAFSKEIEGDLSDTFNLQGEIAHALARQFKDRAPASASPAIVPPEVAGTERAKAEMPGGPGYLLYMRGKYFLGRRTPDSVAKGRGYLEEAARLDPGFAPIYSQLANSYGLETYYGYVAPRKSYESRMRYAEKALALDPMLPDAMLVLAQLKAYFDFDWMGAGKIVERILDEAPSEAIVHQWYAEILTYERKFDRSAEEIARALELDPLSLGTNVSVCANHYAARRYKAAIKQCKATLEMDPQFMLGHFWLGLTYAEVGKHSESIAELEKAVKLSGGEPMMKSGLGYAYAIGGRPEGAARVLADLEALSGQRYVSPYDRARLMIGLERRKEALELLEQAFRERDSHIVMLDVDPVFDRIHNNPEFISLERRLNFTP